MLNFLVLFVSPYFVLEFRILLYVKHVWVLCEANCTNCAEFCDVKSELTYSTVRARNIESMVGKTAVHAEKKLLHMINLSGLQLATENTLVFQSWF